MSISIYGNCIKDFKIEKKIGKGGFGEVFKARGLLDDYVAVKKISKKCAAERKCIDRIKNEIYIHSNLPTYPAFVKLHTSFEDDNYWYLVLELCDGGSLEEYLKSRKSLPEEEAVKLIKQVIDGVWSLHDHCIIHRDLSLRNLLLSSVKNGYQVKIADFGLAVVLKNNYEKKNTLLGTVNYMSPEIVNHDSYAFKTDCWSIGCVLYALLYGSLPFNGKTRKEIMENVKYSPLKFPHYASKEAKELLEAMLNKDEKKRIDLQDVMKFAFFHKYEKTNESNLKKSSGDSGMSSLSSSGSKKSQFAHKSSSEYDCEPNYHKSKKDKESRYVKNAPVTRSNDNTRFGHQYDHVTSQIQRTDCTLCQDRPDSVCDTPIKKRPECPSYPVELQNLADRNLNSQIYYSEHDSLSGRSHSIKHYSIYEQQSCAKNCIDCPVKDSSCSHNQYCAPDSNYLHKQSYCCQQMRSNFCPLGNCTKERKHCVDVRSKGVEKKDIVEPLNTERLPSRRQECKVNQADVIVSILSDGQVCLEYLNLEKRKKKAHHIYFISGNGLEIIFYKSKKAAFLNPDQAPPNSKKHKVQYFYFENLPKEHWRMYAFAKKIVDIVRGITPKVTIYGEHAACIMMENIPNPNYEMKFYNGFQITEKKNKITVKDKNDCTITLNDDDFMLKEFANMKDRCIRFEKYIEAYPESNFPVILGKKPDVYKRKVMQDNSKENISAIHLQSPSLNGLNSGIKHCHITIGTENSLLQNTVQSTLNPYSNGKSMSTSSSNSMINMSPYLKNLELTKRWTEADCEDDDQLYGQRDKMYLKEAGARKFISHTQHHHLKQFQYDSQDLIHYSSSLKEKERKTRT